jgi:hypothetical protein
MNLESRKFHVVQTPDEDHIVQSEEQAIDILSSIDIDPDNDDVQVVKVDYSDDDWAIQSLAWQRIAIKLLARQ